ncbi:MAG: DUF4124 domain-containing protein [Pseudomonadota bacterium]|nr:DUF4124 domain-containing protein [Pseudomonadota bacterium]
MIERLPWPLLCAALCAAASPVLAEMYKWRDAAGQVHYSESPPPGRPVETIKPPPKVDSAKARDALDKEIEKFDIRADERRDQEEEARKEAAEDKDNQVACEEARRQARSLADKPRSYRSESDGTRVTQTDEEHQASIAQTRAWIAELCQP